MLKAILALIFHFGGLAAVAAGAVMLIGWPGALITIGLWGIFATSFDVAMERLSGRTRFRF